MANVIVEVPTVEESVQVYWLSTVHVVNTVIVVRFVASLFVTEKLPTLIAPSAMLPDPISVRPLNVMLWPVFVRTAPLFTVRVPADVPAINEEPRPDVFQLPPTVHDPLVRVMVPDVPPIIVTFETAVVDAFATRRPASPIMRAPPVKARSFVVRVVVPL